MANDSAEFAKKKATGEYKTDYSPVPEKKKKEQVQIFVPGQGVQNMDDFYNQMSEKTNENNVLKLDTAEAEGNFEKAKEAVQAGVDANKKNKTQPSTYLKEKAEEYGVEIDTPKKTEAPQKKGSDLGGLSTEEWYLKMLEQGYSPDEIAALYEKEGYSRNGSKFLAAAEKYKDWKKESTQIGSDSLNINDILKNTDDEEKKNLLEKLKSKLTNKDLEKYAKENGISYGRALSYTLAAMLKGLANNKSIVTGVKPFADEETQSPLYNRYKVTSGKVDEEQGTTQAEKNYIENAETHKEAGEIRGATEGRQEGAKEIGNITYQNENGQEMVNFANLQASLRDISDAQELRTLEKKLGLERASSEALQKFLSDLNVNAAYRMGWNNIKLEKDKIKLLGDYLVEHPDAIENYIQYGQEMRKSGMTEAEIAGQWVDTVAKPVEMVVEGAAAGATKGATGGVSDRRVKNYIKVTGGKCK